MYGLPVQITCDYPHFQNQFTGITSDNWNLKFPALSEIDIYVSPYEQEQAKIAAYFANLDHLITLHQRKFYIYGMFNFHMRRLS